ncbi:MAG: hypothetical protein IJ817_01315 [Clostridia bacterium]|nr:hypothetical protein [Clostridia bacterium]
MTEQDILENQNMIDADKEALTKRRRALHKAFKEGKISSEEFNTQLEAIQNESAMLSYEQHNLDILWSGLCQDKKERKRQEHRREVYENAKKGNRL